MFIRLEAVHSSLCNRLTHETGLQLEIISSRARHKAEQGVDPRLETRTLDKVGAEQSAPAFRHCRPFPLSIHLAIPSICSTRGAAPDATEEDPLQAYRFLPNLVLDECHFSRTSQNSLV
jgi:hypothetical protein